VVPHAVMAFWAFHGDLSQLGFVHKVLLLDFEWVAWPPFFDAEESHGKDYGA
jgi:hypothetical protein